ncbi:MAG: TGS domain-containing protein [Rhizomicrobium sp.]
MSAAAAVHITLPDGTTKEFERGVTGADIASSIGPGLAKAALIVEVNGRQWDLFRPIETDANIRIITKKDPEALELIRHDAAHVLAMAVQDLFPGTQVTIGPAIEDGFYYDFARAEPFTPDDLPKIEAKMHEIVKAGLPTAREVWPRAKAIQHFKDIGETYKAELIESIPSGRGRVDLLSRQLARPVPRAAFRDHRAGRRRLQADQAGRRLLARRRQERPAPAHLRHRLARQEGTGRLSRAARRAGEARPPAHRKDLELFTFSPDVGAGLPLWMPNGMVIRQELNSSPPRKSGATATSAWRHRRSPRKISTSAPSTWPSTRRTCTRRSISRARTITSSR